MDIYRSVKNSAYEIIDRKGATYYGIASAVARISQCIVRDEHSVLPVSAYLDGLYGVDGLCMSVPTVVGRDGAEKVLEIELSDSEREAFRKSAETLKSVATDIGL